MSPRTGSSGETPLLVEVEELTKSYALGGGLASALRGRGAQEVRAVNGVSFRLRRGESLGLAGESGCGKTTTGKLLVRLLDPTSGRVRFDGENVSDLTGSSLKEFRSRAQLMFQNPYEALNPRFTLYRSLTEPLAIHGWGDEDDRLERVLETLTDVNLKPPEFFLDKYPHQLSGGQLQRVVLARALVLRPEFLVADEPVSMLDVSVRAGILNTMRGLARKLGLATLYISHDLSLLQYTCDRIAVMYFGHIVEIGPARDVISNPKHPYTQALISSVPIPDPSRPHPRPRIHEGGSRPGADFTGCPFQERCPDVMEACTTIFPPWVEPNGQAALCHLYGDHSESRRLRAPKPAAP